MESGPLLAGLDVGLTQVDTWVQIVGKRFGDRFDAFEVGPRGREQRLRPGNVAGLDRGGECLGGRDQRFGLAGDVTLVVRGGLSELTVGVDAHRGAGHQEVTADTVADHAGLAGGAVGAGFGEVHNQLALQARRDVLHLAEHPIAGAVHVELGGLAAVVGDEERAGPGGGLGRRQRTGRVGGVDGDRLPGPVGGGGLLGGASGHREGGQNGCGSAGTVEVPGHAAVLSGVGLGFSSVRGGGAPAGRRNNVSTTAR